MAQNHPALHLDYVRQPLGAEKLAELISTLRGEGTFHFPRFDNGLFPAASGVVDHAITGYRNVWVRDNVHIAHALWVDGQTGDAAQAVGSLMRFFQRHAFRFTNIITGKADPADPMNRPHIRFSGQDLSENPERWSHAQNDALGYFVWIFCRLVSAKVLELDADDGEMLSLFVRYFATIAYWEDEDSGHWEETRKINGSSIGVVVAGLEALRHLLVDPDATRALPSLARARMENDLEPLILRGRRALASILPSECVQPDEEKARAADSACLFLILPLDVVDDETADRILEATQPLHGEIGIRRYLGDSYWCADYKRHLSIEKRTADYSGDLHSRDRLLRPGEEAQWCIFDPILSAIHGRRYQRTGSAAAFERQVHHLERSLRQLTDEDSPFGTHRCPESYYLENGTYVPNDVTPLLWTQANLLIALHAMKRSIQASRVRLD